jgi:hypothetical protein
VRPPLTSSLIPRVAPAVFGSIVLGYGTSQLLSAKFGSAQAETTLERVYLVDDHVLLARANESLEEGPAQNVPVARALFQKLVLSNSASSDRWADLGAAFDLSGQRPKGKYCFARAAELSPNSAQSALSIARHFVNTNRIHDALPYFGHILQSATTANYDSEVFNYFDTLKLGFDEIASNRGLPAEPRSVRAYFRHVLANDDLSNASKVWTWMRSNVPPSDAMASEYVQFLLRKNQAEEASLVWRSQVAERDPTYTHTTFIYNGDFEQEPTGAPFDWRLAPYDHVQTERDASGAYSGKSSVRIAFDGQENVKYEGLSQLVFVTPGTYRFQAFIRVKGITTDEGVRFRLFDSEAGNRLMIETEAVTGTHGWTKLEKDFVVTAPTRLLAVQPVRRPSLRFDSLIAGTAWIDHISLERTR